ncbi:MAG: hypothetical protein M3Y74_11635 [Chloroflexota bacterium]|nr:hypothetical protein [Chloroflexota bacterium]
MRGEWECKSDTVWSYRLAGDPRPYGSVVQYRDTARSYGDWDALVTAGGLADDTTIAEGVSFDEAKVALERHAQQQADGVDRAGERGTGR